MSKHKELEKWLADLLQQAIDMSGNEFAMGYDDSGCFWRFYYGSRGAGSMMEGWPHFQSESPEVNEALEEFIAYLTEVRQKGSNGDEQIRAYYRDDC